MKIVQSIGCKLDVFFYHDLSCLSIMGMKAAKLRVCKALASIIHSMEAVPSLLLTNGCKNG